MGRPLFSTLIATAEPVVRVAEVETPTCERWSAVNPFDPDADEFFEGDDAVYEAFLTPEEVAQREQEQRALEAQGERVQMRRDDIRERLIHSLAVSGHLTRDAVDGILLQNAQLQRPELVEDDSASSSEGTASGRVSPSQLAADLALQFDRTHPSISQQEVDNQPLSPETPNPRHSISLPGSPPYAPSQLFESILASGDIHETMLSMPVRSAPIPVQHSPHAASTAMTPPGSVTPRFLSWHHSRPRAIPMSPSPTPDAPFGSLRASRMAVSYLAPIRPSIGVQL